MANLSLHRVVCSIVIAVVLVAGSVFYLSIKDGESHTSNEIATTPQQLAKQLKATTATTAAPAASTAGEATQPSDLHDQPMQRPLATTSTLQYIRRVKLVKDPTGELQIQVVGYGQEIHDSSTGKTYMLRGGSS